jgi:hypothetical protein
MDDILFVSSKPVEEINEILSCYLGSDQALNEIDWTIVDADDKPAVFLDVSVSLGRSSECGGKRRLITSMYQKPISLHSYLPFHSRHMPHVLRSWVASETRRIARLCFRKQDFDTIASSFKERLIRRGYPLEVIHIEMSKVDWLSTQHNLLHKDVKLVGCALCQAATHVLKAGTKRARTDPKLEGINTLREQDISTSRVPRFFKLPIRPNLSADPKRLKDVISIGLERVEEIRNLFTLKTSDAEAVLKSSPTLGQALLNTQGSPSFIQMLADNLTEVIKTGKSKKKTYVGQKSEVAKPREYGGCRIIVNPLPLW